MTAQTILPANSVTGGFEVANSCRFNSGSTDSLDRTPSSSGSGTTFTMSMWLKRSGLGGRHLIYKAKGSAQTEFTLAFNSDKLQVYQVNSSGAQDAAIKTLSVQRDISAWYHACIQIQTADGTATDRCKIYINGVQQTIDSSGTDAYGSSFNTGVNQASVKQEIGGAASPYGGYMAEFVMIDGSILAPTSFAEADEDSGIWKPKSVSGLTFGTNGFYLDFEDSSALGNDAAGSNNFTARNLTAIDQSTDTCTNNFCVINSLDNSYAGSTLSEGNLKVLTISGNAAYNPATFGLTKGKWYWEVKLVTCSAGDNSEATIIGISNQSPVNAGYTGSIVVNDGLGIRGDGNAWGADGSAGGGASTSGWDAIAVGNTAMIAVDFDNGKLYHGINGTWGNSGDPTSGSTGTGAYAFTVGTDAWFPGVNQRETSQTATFELNFGSPPFAISSGNTDGDGYGNFEYAVPSGYLALCTKNLSEVLS